MLRVAKKIDLPDRRLESRQLESFTRLENGEIEFSGLGRASPIGLGVKDRVAPRVLFVGVGVISAKFVAERRGAGAIDGLAVDLEPAAHGAQVILAGLRNQALGGGTDIQQVVAAFADDVHKFERQVFGRFPVVVIVLVAPRVDSAWRALPNPRERPRWESGCRPSSGSRLRCRAGRQSDRRAGACGRCQRTAGPRSVDVHHARRVEPDQTDRAVAGEQLLHLRLGFVSQVLVKILLVVGSEIPGVAGAVRLVPVLRLRVVEAEPDAVPGAGLGQLLERVALERRGIHDVVLADLGAIHREAVVVLAGDDDVFHPGVLGQLHPFLGVELHRIELCGKLLVFLHRNLGAVHDPLADAGDRLALPFPAGTA